MTLYLLDTNTISYLSDSDSPFHSRAKRRLGGLPSGDEGVISVLTLYELTYGFSYDPARSRLLSIVRAAQVRIDCSQYRTHRLLC